MFKKKEFIAIFAIAALLGNVFAAELTSSDKKSGNKETQAKTQSADPSVAFVQDLQGFLERGDLNGAIASFDKMPSSIKDDTGLLLIKASLLISASRLDEASEVVAAIEQADPSNIEALEMRIILAKAAGKGAKDVQAKKAAISKVLALDPNNATANIELAQEQVLNHKYKLAKTYYQKALISDPQNMNALFGYGQTSYYLNAIEDSRAAFKKMLKLNPNEAIAYQYLGKLEAEDENYKPALEYIKKAIELDPTNSDFYMDLGTYSRFRGMFAEAEKAWSKAIQLNPSDFLAYAYRAGLYDEQNKFDLALKDYRKVIETNPKYYFAYESLGILAWHEGQWEEARKAFEKAYSYNKENYSYPLMIAACYIKNNQYQMAKQFLAQVMKTMAEKNTLEYSMIRLYHDFGPSNAENDIAVRIQKEDKTNTRGKMLFYFGLYYQMKGTGTLAAKYFMEVKNMQSPMFFEYRLAEWGLE
ncbi:tetratricopeptide repeat protein [Treponema sp.]|uniref:tetratricopeptide repeat protein n=1 Tax=Treponema sp. TaxID=166 RepID=UPI00298EA71A|nr:tetratricopeptide repeat protein [Treponema sp.]MCR5613528.1 tetratricopeptide repeat protein [Treponema sp.]